MSAVLVFKSPDVNTIIMSPYKMHILLCVGLFFLLNKSWGQLHATDGVLEGRVSLFEKANTAGSEAYLSESEKSLILILNTARLHGPTFVRRYLVLVKDTTTERYASVKNRLLVRKPTEPLYPAFQLTKSASIQASDMGRNGLQGTTTSDGRSFVDRMHEQLPGAGGYASASYLGSADPLDVILHLMVEESDTNFLNMLLSPKLDYIGVAIRPHKLNCSNTILDFARRPKDIPVASTNPKKRKTEAYFLDCPKGSKVATPRKSTKSGGILGWLF